MEDSRYQILRLSIKLHLLRPRGFGAKMENQVSGTEESLETENKHLVVSKAETIRWGKEGLFINDTGAGGYPNERQ